ncbi:Erythronate-4-phosphate dehydrogenase [Parasponia andersonii]|uniref:glyoxylate reductase (NADP(+)) n=1 Tax=Parasponia andersonii TaxID=3476 RepID=A0A2P5CVT0_PARAD|nr:Erythronate-4-phosphate dehydrogenase [Parasponia andersonii]
MVQVNTTQAGNGNSKDLPVVLVLRPPPVLKMFEDRFAERFRILKAYNSGLPLDRFLASSPQAQSATALLCYGGIAMTDGIPISGEILRQLPSLKIVVSTSTGVNYIDVSECRRLGISVVNAGDSVSEDVADMAVGLFIDVLRKISAADRYVRKGCWAASQDFPLGYKLRDKRVGIIGLGNIGTRVAKRLEAFGCKISYNSRKKKDSISYHFYNDLCELAAESDALIICCNLNDQTRHMIDGKVMYALGKHGVIVNVGRGEIVNEKEMIECLVRGEIGGAGLEAFEDEPNVPQELLGMENVVLSPHNGIFTVESLESLCEVTIGNLEAFFTQKPLLSEIMEDW